MSFSDGILTLGGSSGNRFTVGATDTSTSTTTATSMSGMGMFDLSGKTCTITVVAAADQTAGTFQVFVDNNTTSSGNSPLGSASRVFSGLLTSGTNTLSFASTLTTSGTDFLMIRADSTASATGTLQIDSIDLECQ